MPDKPATAATPAAQDATKAAEVSETTPAGETQPPAPATPEPQPHEAQAAASEPHWFQVTTPTQLGAYNVLAADVESAKERFKKAFGIRHTPHPITVIEHPATFRPSANDEDFERLIDLNDAPRR